jgi:superfamily II DNA or RNA helicase
VDYPVNDLRNKVVHDEGTLNIDQRQAYNAIVSAYESGESKNFFIDDPGGTGKTYIENLFLKKIRGNGDIALIIASSRIAALLLDGGRTAHSQFKIPI